MSLADAEYGAAEEYAKVQHEVAVEKSKRIEKHYEHKHPNDSASSSDSEVSSEDSQDPSKRDEGKTGYEIFCEEIVMLKWRILVLCCFLPFGSYWVYDFPGAIGSGPTNTIEALFDSKHKEYTNEMNQALYSVYSWPNTVLAFGGGILIDNIMGLRKGMFLFTTLVLLGTVIFYVGVCLTNYPLMIFARFVFGLGGESLSVAQSAYVAKWFRGQRGIALAYGITISFSRVGSSFNFLFSPEIAKDINVQTSVLVGTCACAFSLITCIMLMVLDKHGENKGLVAKETIKMLEPGGSYFKLSDVTTLNIRFWVACAICVTVYCAIFPLIGVIKQFFQVRYGVTAEVAGTYVSFYQFTCAGGSTLVGGVVDKVGRFVQWIILSSSLFTISHVLLLFTKISAIFMMMLMGVAYSILAASLWTSVPYIVPAASVGLSFGICTAMQNTGLAIYPLLSGAILDKYTPPKTPLVGWCYNFSESDFKNDTDYPDGSLIGCKNNTDAPNPTWEGFRDTEILFAFTAFAGVLLGIWLYVLDLRSDPPVLSVAADVRPPSPEEVEEKANRRAMRKERRKQRKLDAQNGVKVDTNENNKNNGDEKTSLLGPTSNNDMSINKSYMSNSEM